MKLYKPICLLSLLNINNLCADEFQISELTVKSETKQLFSQASVKADLAAELTQTQVAINDAVSLDIATEMAESLNNINDDMRYLAVGTRYDNALASTQSIE